MKPARLEALTDGAVAIIGCNGPQSAVAPAIGRDWKGIGRIASYIVAALLA